VPAVARAPFRGRAINHQSVENVAKALRIHRGEEPADVLSPDKMRHFGDAIWTEHNPADPRNHGPETVAADKHIRDVLAGERSGWGGKDECGYKQRVRASGDPYLPDETGAGYRYGRDAVTESATRHGERPKVHQGIVWPDIEELLWQHGLVVNGDGIAVPDKE
jgi:hypothetical protein